MDLTPDGPLGDLDQDMNTLPTETVDTTHHGSTGSDLGQTSQGTQQKDSKRIKRAFGAQFAEWDVEAR